ncbi:PLDc N-terminal domain-containing protein [Paenibacillus sp. D51F]
MYSGVGLFGIGFLFIGFLFFALHVALCAWAYRDARRRGHSSEYALIVLLALLVAPMLGLIVYLLIRGDGSYGDRRY